MGAVLEESASEGIPGAQMIKFLALLFVAILAFALFVKWMGDPFE